MPKAKIPSKYLVDPRSLMQYNEQQLKSYIRGALKTLSKKIQRTRQNEYADFSELLDMLDTVSSRWGGALTGATKGLSAKELKRKALDINALFAVQETPSQLQKEGVENIANFFKAPRYTRAFIERMHRNKSMLKKIVKNNEDFIWNILPSETINRIANEVGDNSSEFYRRLLLETSDALDLMEQGEKEKVLEDWKNPYNYLGGSLWREESTGKIIDTATGEDWKE